MKFRAHNDLLRYLNQRVSATGVGAAFVEDITEPGRDGARRWRFLVVDQVGHWAYVDFLAMSVARTANLIAGPLENAVERFIASNYPCESRLESLVAAYTESEGDLPIHFGARDLQRAAT